MTNERPVDATVPASDKVQTTEEQIKDLAPTETSVEQVRGGGTPPETGFLNVTIENTL